MQDSVFDELGKCLSVARLTPFKTHSCRTATDIVCRYLWNVALSEAFYPLLNTLEIGLRNRCDSAMAMKMGKGWLTGTHFDAYQIELLHKAMAELDKHGKPHDHGRVVAELHFGFWCSLFSPAFEHQWHGVLKHAFPGLKGPDRTRKTIAARLDEVRRFRNRIFHHERIIHMPFMQVHKSILEIIDWMGPELLAMAGVCDRVHRVNEDGPTVFVNPLGSAFPESNSN